MADRAVVDRVFNAIIEQTSEEVSALLGATFTLEGHQTKLLTKEQVFEIKRNRSILSAMEISGDQEGRSFLITSQKDAITLGGTLIMLPPDQIEENCKQRTFEGEAADAFGEVANIIAGAYTSIFLEMYPENLHFKRTDVNEFIPTKLDPASDLPFPPGEYFYSSCSIKLEDQSMETLEAIFPAQIFGLASSPDITKSTQQENAVSSDELSDNPTDGDSANAEAPPALNADTQEPGEYDTEQDHQEKEYIELSVADRVLKASITQCAEEIGGMLDIEIGLSSLSTSYISKREYFSRPGPKSTVTEMVVNGDLDGTSYFITDLKDSIYFGGTLVMLPDDELKSRMKSGKLDGEIEDAFGEVANIISGGIVQNFDEMFPRKFHVKKGSVEAFTPTKVMIENPKPFPDGEYYSVSASMDSNSHDLGRLSYLVPVELLHIPPRPAQTGWGDASSDDKTDTMEPPKAEKGEPREESVQKKGPEQKPTTEQTQSSRSQDKSAAVKEPVIAVVYKNNDMTEQYTSILSECGHKSVPLAANESFNSLRQNKVCGSLLIIDKVDDDAFALIIKIRSETPTDQPLIVAGPNWTRSAVLKAVKYGVNDIIPTPATTDEIRGKVQQNLKNSC